MCTVKSSFKVSYWTHVQDWAREARQIFFSDEQNHRKTWTFSGIFKHILDKKWIFSRSLKKDIDQDMIFCTKRFFDRISRKYPSKFFDIISDLVPGKRIYIRDILSLDIYPYQVWLLGIYNETNWLPLIMQINEVVNLVFHFWKKVIKGIILIINNLYLQTASRKKQF